MDLLNWIYEFIKSPYGGALPCAIIGIQMQIFAYKGMALDKSKNKAQDTFYSQAIGYAVTVAIALVLYFKVNNDILMFLMNVGIALAAHLGYARWLDPWLTNKAKKKSLGDK
jgi:xanthine/uracil permease